jgi:hypothetical protein
MVSSIHYLAPHTAMKSCQEVNSEKDGWRYMLWTDENIEYTVSIKSKFVDFLSHFQH